MKIGVFGDSYAEHKAHDPNHFSLDITEFKV
jgi:hypothetical protein